MTILAGYHQFQPSSPPWTPRSRHHAPGDDHRCGVAWRPQRAGTSLLVFYAGQIITRPAMVNPTVVVITDRNDLDGQLYSTFCGCSELLGNACAGGNPRGSPHSAYRVLGRSLERCDQHTGTAVAHEL